VIGFFIPAPPLRWLHIALLASLLWVWVPASADSRDELKTLTRRIDRIVQELNKLHGKEVSVERSLTETERRIGKTAAALRRLEQQIQEAKRRRHRLQDSLDEHRMQLERQRSRLAAQLRISYALGRKTPLQFMMNLDDPATLSRTLTYHRYFHRARLEQIRETRRRLQEIHALTHEIEQNQSRLSALLKQKHDELDALRHMRKERKKNLALLRKRMTDKRLRLAKMKQDKQRLGKLLESVSRASDSFAFPDAGERPFEQYKGRFHWPVSGRIKVRFGAPRGLGRWEGMILSAPEGSPVRAIHSGKVIFSDWLRGYGQLIILRHDRDFMTLYAFNQTLLKQVGERVKAGEIIATVGDSGGRDEPGVYFAIRYRGEPVNPLRWCRRPRKNRVN